MHDDIENNDNTKNHEKKSQPNFHNFGMGKGFKDIYISKKLSGNQNQIKQSEWRPNQLIDYFWNNKINIVFGTHKSTIHYLLCNKTFVFPGGKKKRDCPNKNNNKGEKVKKICFSQFHIIP